MSDLTPWFPISTPPTHLGVYQVYEWDSDKGRYYSYWDGCQFNWLSSVSPAVAYETRLQSGAGPFMLGWRGLAEKPV